MAQFKKKGVKLRADILGDEPLLNLGVVPRSSVEELLREVEGGRGSHQS